jgi:hypothetical protein
MYPRAWRRRYEDEVVSLIDSGPVRLGDVCGLLRNGITERVLSLYEPSRHITAYRFITGLALMLFILVMMLAVFTVGAVPFALGYLVQMAIGRVTSDWLYLLMFLLLFLPYGRLQRLKWIHMKSGTPLPASATRLRWIAVGGFAGFSMLAGMESDLAFRWWSLPVIHSWILAQMLLPDDLDGVRWPGMGLFETLGRLHSVRHDLRWAKMELDRCEGLYAGREPGPELRAARAEMDRLTTDEANAMAALDAMGYHARFQG